MPRTAKRPFVVEHRTLPAPTSAAFELPVPPSVNACFGTNFKTKRRFKSKAYEDWLTLAGYALKAAKVGSFVNPVELTVTIKEPIRYSDIDNFCKPLLDLLVTHNVLQGDDNRYVRRIVAEWGDVRFMSVQITALGEWVQRRKSA